MSPVVTAGVQTMFRPAQQVRHMKKAHPGWARLIRVQAVLFAVFFLNDISICFGFVIIITFGPQFSLALSFDSRDKED